jgi:hypothetical protein
MEKTTYKARLSHAFSFYLCVAYHHNMQLCKIIIWTLIILILYIEFHIEEKKYFLDFLYIILLALYLYFIIQRKIKKIFFKQVLEGCKKPLDFLSKKFIWTLTFFLNTALFFVKTYWIIHDS